MIVTQFSDIFIKMMRAFQAVFDFFTTPILSALKSYYVGNPSNQFIADIAKLAHDFLNGFVSDTFTMFDLLLGGGILFIVVYTVVRWVIK